MGIRTVLENTINRKLYSLGIKAPERIKDTKDDEWKKIGTVHIIPKSLGLMAPVFEKIELEIKGGVSVENESAHIIFEYHWKHPSGSNGYRVQYNYSNLVWKQSS